MGYSCSAKAHDVLRMTLNTINGEDTNPQFSNTWTANGKQYFFERGREHDDGTITGTVYLMTGETCRKYGSLKIKPDGTIDKWAGMPSTAFRW